MCGIVGSDIWEEEEEKNKKEEEEEEEALLDFSTSYLPYLASRTTPYAGTASSDTQSLTVLSRLIIKIDFD